LRFRDQFGLATRVQVDVDDRESASEFQHPRPRHQVGQLRFAQEVDV